MPHNRQTALLTPKMDESVDIRVALRQESTAADDIRQQRFQVQRWRTADDVSLSISRSYREPKERLRPARTLPHERQPELSSLYKDCLVWSNLERLERSEDAGATPFWRPWGVRGAILTSVAVHSFQILKSETSTTASPVKLPSHHDDALVNLLPCHRLKSSASTWPSKLASP